MPRYGHENDGRRQRHLQKGAEASRPHIRRPEDEAGEQRNRSLRERKVLVRGRLTRTGEVYDVLDVLGGKATLYASDIKHHGEALEMALNCLRGRVFVSLGFGRTPLRASKSGLLVAGSSGRVEAASPIPHRPVEGQTRTWEVRDPDDFVKKGNDR